MAYSLGKETGGVLAPAATRRRQRTVTPWQVAGRVGEILAYIVILVFILLPIGWIALTAFKDDANVYSRSLVFPPTLANFNTIFTAPLNFGPLVVNSVVVSVITIAISTPLALMAAYAFSRYVFKGSNILLVWVLTTQFIPAVVTLLPFYTLFRTLQLTDTRLALVILNLSTVLPYAIWLLKGFIDTLPAEVEEAAMVDGCSEFGILRHVTLPLVVPGIIVTSVFGFISVWNEFLFAFIITRREAVTLQVGLLNLSGVKGVQWNLMSATGLVVMVPIFLLSFAIRKYFVQGFTMGAVK